MAKYYRNDDKSFHPIPKAKWYVLSNDSFMSNWGHATGLINTCVVPCDTLEEAEAVERYARSRSDQRYIRIAAHVRAKSGVLYSLVDGWKERAK